MEPNEDRNGRLHAPCDGYEHFETGELYGKGQFIVMPEYDDWYSPVSYPAKMYDPNTRFKGKTADYQEVVKLMESFNLRVKLVAAGMKVIMNIATLLSRDTNR